MRPDPPGPIRTLHDTELREHAGELVALQRRAYRVEAELIGDDRIPQLSETAAELIGADLVWKTVHDDAQVVAALAYSIEEGALEIDRLVVDPAWHRRGLARADNAPARALYASLRFTHIGDREVAPGLWASDYARGRPGARLHCSPST